MKALLIYSDLAMGGVQTTIVQFANWMAGHGHEITLAVYDKGELAPALSEKVRMALLPRPPACFRPGALGREGGPLSEGVYDVVCSFDPLSMWLAALYYRDTGGGARFHTGVYHPRIYFFQRGISPHEALCRLLFDRYVPDDGKFFMNEECRRSHERYFKRPFAGSAVLPVPIQLAPTSSAIRHPKKYRIVSMGRLVSFKTYNIYMLDVVQELLGKGCDVVWDVYGDGAYKSEMLRQIALRKLEGRVFLRGTVPYQAIPKILESAYAFVGMGISLVLAGAHGVPSVPAIGERGAMSYGYVYDLPLYSVGEVLDKEPGRKVSDLLWGLFQMNEEQYEGECARTRDHCRRFDVEQVAPLFSARLEAEQAGTSQLLKAPTCLFWLAYCLAVIGAARAMCENVMFKSLHALLPRKVALALREWRRQRIGRQAIAENCRKNIV